MSQAPSDLTRMIQAETARESRAPDRNTETTGLALVERLHREARSRHSESTAAPVETRTIHFSQLPVAQPDSPLVREWNTYRREVGRLLADGQRGRWVLIHGDQVIGFWDSEAEAEAAGSERFSRLPFLVHRVAEHEPLLRGPSVLWRCHD
ncbi:MAG: hypothetical protein JNM56_26570 [Planctomycetia bacterium]|nr:hypothetical protein [Planctomycetia bacterium]